MCPRSMDCATWRPRRWNARSTANANTKASTSVSAALIQSELSCQNVLPRSSAGMDGQPNQGHHAPPRAVLLDAMGTLLTFRPPAPLLRAELRERLGVDVGPDAAVAAEIAYYRAHLDEGRDVAALAELRARCAEAMRPALPEPVASAPRGVLL